tara:strand:- start:16 stop:435 length:420 start_codon:yes stop_codon:yes gene_type:complete
MKNTIIVLALLSCSLHAADVVVVVSATSVTVNGYPAGKPADTIRNRPELASAIQLALEQREAEQAAALAVAKSELAAALARRAALVTLAKEKLVLLPADAQVILSNVLYQAELPDTLLRRAAAAAEFAAAQKKFDEANK